MKNLLTALLAVMNEAGYAKKGGKHAQGYSYVSEADLLAVLRPAMIKHGLVLLGPTVDGAERHDAHGNVYVTLSWQLAHAPSGEVWPVPISVVGAGSDKSSKQGMGDKAIYKATTGAVKYMLYKMFLFATGDDPENEAAGTYAPDQVEEAEQPAPAHLQGKIAEEMKRIGWGPDEGKAYLVRTFNKVSRSQLTTEQAQQMIHYLMRQKPAGAVAESWPSEATQEASGTPTGEVW